MNGIEREKLLEHTLETLSASLLLVEGKHDVKALGVAVPGSECLPCNGPVERIVDSAVAAARGRTLGLLFDFDEEGERKARVFESRLLAEPVTIDRSVRKAVKTVFGIRTLEELPHALERVREEIALTKSENA